MTPRGDTVQTTLLGLAIAFIVALVTALTDPTSSTGAGSGRSSRRRRAVSWGRRSRRRRLDARLLPTPSLRLQSVVIGGANDPGRIRADDLAVEFSLGALMRGNGAPRN